MTVDEFLRLLREARVASDESIRHSFDRSLPFADAAFDRWERAKRLGFGEGSSIYDSALVYGRVRVGSQSWIGPNVVLDGSGGGLSIGDYCAVSAGVHIYTHDTVKWALSGGKHGRRTAPVAIGSCTYIGPNAVIVAGVTVGQQCVIGAQSFVKQDVPDCTFVAGAPARPRGRVEVTAQDVIIRSE